MEREHDPDIHPEPHLQIQRHFAIHGHATWDPNVNGTVNTIAFNGGNCSTAYIGGQFTTVGGAAAKNIAAVDTTTGALVPGFKDNAGGQVETILAVNGHLLVGGFFKGINGSTTDPYYTSLSPTTGKNDNFLDLGISGHITFKGVKNNSTEVYNQQLSHGGTLVLVEGDFTTVGGQNRRQIFMIDVSGATATLTGWTSPEFDGSDPNGTLNPNDQYFNCGASHPFYIHAAAWSPDDSEIYLADTGVKPILWNGTFPMVGMCDAAAAFPATQTQVFSDWIAYDGCDSLYSVAADDSAVYVSGHNRWFNNQNQCNKAGPGAIPAPGLRRADPRPDRRVADPQLGRHRWAVQPVARARVRRHDLRRERAVDRQRQLRRRYLLRRAVRLLRAVLSAVPVLLTPCRGCARRGPWATAWHSRSRLAHRSRVRRPPAR